MKAQELVGKAPVTVQRETTLLQAAGLMDSANVGALLVLEGSRLVGIVTDRDMVVRAVARGYPLEARIDSVMSTDVVTVDADAEVHEVYRILGRHGVRRLPVLRGSSVVGLLSVDDLLAGLAMDLSQLAHPVIGELLFGHHPAPVPAVPVP